MSSRDEGRLTAAPRFGRKWSSRTRAAALAGVLAAGLAVGLAVRAALVGAADRSPPSEPRRGEVDRVDRVSPYARYIREQAESGSRKPVRVKPFSLSWARARRIGGERR